MPTSTLPTGSSAGTARPIPGPMLPLPPWRSTSPRRSTKRFGRSFTTWISSLWEWKRWSLSMNEKVFLDPFLTQGITRNFSYIFVARFQSGVWHSYSERSKQEAIVQRNTQKQWIQQKKESTLRICHVFSPNCVKKSRTSSL